MPNWKALENQHPIVVSQSYLEKGDYTEKHNVLSGLLSEIDYLMSNDSVFRFFPGLFSEDAEYKATLFAGWNLRHRLHCVRKYFVTTKFRW